MTLATDITRSIPLPRRVEAPAAARADALGARLAPLDWMRGLVMILMVTDHASASFNAGRLSTDGAALSTGEPLDVVQFLFRWISHLCAPTFLFLAGTSLALSIARKEERGVSGRAIDRDLFVRGLLVLAVDLFVMSPFFPGVLFLQVMFAIGVSMMAMAALRRLPTTWLLAGGLAVFLVTESVLTGEWAVAPAAGSVVRALLFTGGDVPVNLLGFEHVWIWYPVAPWCALMAFGWAFGRCLLRIRESREERRALPSLLFLAGCTSLFLFVLIRALNGFGNNELLRADASFVEWLHVSKYPPSLSFVALELGLMSLVLSLFFVVREWMRSAPNPWNPVLVFGQTAFFFYVAHIVMLKVAAKWTGLEKAGDLRDTLLAFSLCLIVLYPACLAYRHLKTKHPRSLLRYF